MRPIRPAMLAFSVCALVATPALADDIRLFATGAVQHSVMDITAAFEAETGNKVIATFGTAGAIGKKLEAGEKADIVVSSSGGLKDLKALLVEGDPQVVGRVRIAIGVKSGAPKPDISTPEKLKAVLLAAPNVGYGDPASGATTGIHFAKVLDQLGIADQIKPKAVLRDGGILLMKEVAEGRAVMGFTQSTEINAVPGTEIAGYLPDALQLVSSYAAALTREGEKNNAAKALFARIIGAPGTAAFAHAGFEVKK